MRRNQPSLCDPQLRYKKDCAIENLSSRQGNPLPMQRRKEEYKQREIMHSIVAIPGVSSLRVESFVRSCTLPRAAALCLDARYDRCSAHILPMCIPQIARTGEENTCARTNWNIESVYDVQRKVVAVGVQYSLVTGLSKKILGTAIIVFQAITARWAAFVVLEHTELKGMYTELHGHGSAPPFLSHNVEL